MFCKIIPILLLTVFLVQCTDEHSKEKNHPVIIKAEIKNAANEGLYVLNKFNDTLDIQFPDSINATSIILSGVEDDYYILKYGKHWKNKTTVFLRGGDSLFLSFDATNFGETLSYSGKGSQRNNYLALKSTPEFDWYSNFHKNINPNKNNAKGSLEMYFKKNYSEALQERLTLVSDDSSFVKMENAELNFELAERILMDRYAFEGADDLDDEVLQSLNWAKSLPLNNSKALNSSLAYLSLLAQRLAMQPSITRTELDAINEKIEKEPFKQYFIEELVFALQKQLQYGEDNFSKAETVASFIANTSPDAGKQTFLLYTKFKELEGIAPTFSYEDVHGKMVSLKDFKGKYVYLDFWATWCGPCLKEIPDLKKLKKKYKDANIVFIGISIDKPDRKDNWRGMIAEKGLQDPQLHAPMDGYIDKDDINDEFLSLMYVNSYYLGIPHFSLIGPDGKIIDAFTYRPSNKKIEDILDNYLEKMSIQ